VANMHNINWTFYKSEYEKFLSHINNNYDFSEMLSEMLGELNASHTGSGYNYSKPNSDETAKLGLFYDPDYKGDGLKIVEIIDKSPVINDKSKVKLGVILEKVDGVVIKQDTEYYQLFNRKAGKNVKLSFFDPKTGNRWDEVVKPITIQQENELLYKRWVAKRKSDTEKASNGRLGYVHVRGMDSQSFRNVFSELLGEYWDKEAVVIDTRFNGGGWLHDDLVTLLSGKKYVDYYPREQHFGYDPMNKWIKSSIVLINESNYSDAHAFPYAYKALGIGKLVGMPVPGTMTAVWWETLQDNTLYFGIPQVGSKDINGNYLENQQLEPDFKVFNEFDKMALGVDQQLLKAIEEVLKP